MKRRTIAPLHRIVALGFILFLVSGLCFGVTTHPKKVRRRAVTHPVVALKVVAKAPAAAIKPTLAVVRTGLAQASVAGGP